MVWAPMVGLVVLVLGVGHVFVWQHIAPPVLFLDGVGWPVLLPVVAVAVPVVVGLLFILLVSQFLECTMNLCDFTSQGDNLLLVGIWACPGPIFDHVSILMLGHLHELLSGKVCNSIVDIVVVRLAPHDEWLV